MMKIMGRHMMLTARKPISGVFATSFVFHFGPPTCFISLNFCRRALHTVFYRRHFFKVEYSCLTTGHTYVAWCAWCWHHVYVLLVRFALAHLRIHFWSILDPRSLLDPSFPGIPIQTGSFRKAKVTITRHAIWSHYVSCQIKTLLVFS